MASKIPSPHMANAWLEACHTQQLSKFRRLPPPIFSFVTYKGGPAPVENYYLSTYPKSSLIMAPHIKTYLQARDIAKEGLPDLHLAWNGGLGPIDPLWGSFPRSVITSASHLTIGVREMFDRNSGGRVHELPRHMLHWLVWNSKYTFAPRWCLKHLTLVDERVYNTREQQPEEDADTSNGIVGDFPMVPGLKTLDLVFMEHPGPVLLEKLSQKCKAHNVECKFIVWTQY